MDVSWEIAVVVLMGMIVAVLAWLLARPHRERKRAAEEDRKQR